MIDFQSNLFIAFVISISFFILRNIILRVYKQEKSKKEILKDSLLVFVVSYFVLSSKHLLFKTENKKIEVFTNEPNF
jgi:hypothetical protein